MKKDDHEEFENVTVASPDETTDDIVKIVQEKLKELLPEEQQPKESTIAKCVVLLEAFSGISDKQLTTDDIINKVVNAVIQTKADVN